MTWQNGRKVQPITWLTTLSLGAFVGLTVWGILHPDGDGKVLMGSLSFLSTQAAAGISYLMGSSAPEQVKAQGHPAAPPPPPDPAP